MPSNNLKVFNYNTSLFNNTHKVPYFLNLIGFFILNHSFAVQFLQNPSKGIC
jgi:Zn-dependent M16 (insulinase) family peptidase